jgi:hypothetical protein
VKRSWGQFIFISLVLYNLRQALPSICGQIWPLLLYLALQILRFTFDIPCFLREKDENIWTISYFFYVFNFVLIASELGAHYAKYQDSTVLYESDLNLWKLSSEFSDFHNLLILYNQTISCSTPIIMFWL